MRSEGQRGKKKIREGREGRRESKEGRRDKEEQKIVSTKNELREQREEAKKES